MIDHYKVFLNVSSHSKNKFICKYLIPFLRKNVQSDYWIERHVEILPVIDIYVIRKRSYKNEFPYLKSFKILLNDFKESLTLSDRMPNNVYINRKNDIRKMNRLKRIHRLPQNFSIMAECISFVKRKGEYTYAEEPMIYNDTFRLSERLYEDTYLYLYNHPQQEMLFIFGLFYFSAKNLDKTGIGLGYRSYQSHVLGFLSYKKENMDGYKNYFEEYYKVNHAILLSFYKLIKNMNSALTDDIELLALIRRWKNVLDKTYEKLFYVQRDITLSLVHAIRREIAQAKFRGYSQFHKVVFDKRHKSMFSTKEFCAYRMLVNFTYLILPNLGLSSRKRVQGGYILVKIMQETEDK